MTAAAPRFRDARQRAGAQAIIAALTAERTYGTAPTDTLLDLGVEELSAVDVAAGGAIMLGKLISDVRDVLGVDVDATIAQVGRWVSTAELEEAHRG